MFLKLNAGNNRSNMPTKRKVNAIFRRLDLNADAKIAFNEFAEAIKPVNVYFTDYDQEGKNESKSATKKIGIPVYEKERIRNEIKEE